MNEYVKNSINSRKDSIYNLYDVKDEGLKVKIESLFEDIEKLGTSCSDVMDFETKFATSVLNTEYINLFTELSSKCTIKPQTYDTSYIQSDEESYKEDVVNELNYATDRLTQPMRSKARLETESKLRSIPVVGELMQANNTMNLFSKFKKKKVETEDGTEEEE